MKQPAFQFYVKDWTSNQKLRRCSEAARGAWIDLLCFLHDSEEYGVARFPLKELAAAAGVSLKSAKELVDKQVLKGGDRSVPAYVHTAKHAGREIPITLLKDSAAPMWYSSRMVVDEWRRARRGEGSRFTPDYQPHRPDGLVNGKVSNPPDGLVVDNPSPTRRTGERQGDGPAVAVAVDLSTTVVTDSNIAPAKTAGGDGSNPNPDAEARILAECRRGKVEGAAPGHEFIARWASHGIVAGQVLLAIDEARKSLPMPQVLRFVYLEPIVMRYFEQDREERERHQRHLEEQAKDRAAARQAAERAAPPPEDLMAPYRGKRAAA